MKIKRVRSIAGRTTLDTRVLAIEDGRVMYQVLTEVGAGLLLSLRMPSGNSRYRKLARQLNKLSRLDWDATWRVLRKVTRSVRTKGGNNEN